MPPTIAISTSSSWSSIRTWRRLKGHANASSRSSTKLLAQVTRVAPWRLNDWTFAKFLPAKRCARSGSNRQRSEDSGHRSAKPRQRIEIDVAAGENNCDALPADVDLGLGNRGIRNCRRRFDHDLHRLPNRAHCRNDRFLAHSHDFIDI